MSGLAAVILAGGRGSRMGGAAKPFLTLGGATLLSRCVDAARAAGCAPVVVVGPRRDEPAGVEWMREEPAFGGPASAIAAGVAGVSAEWTLVLAADLRDPAKAVRAVLAAPRGRDGAFLVDRSGRAQWLAAVYRTSALRRRADELGDSVRDASMRALLSGLDVAGVAETDVGEPGATSDIDTWDHLRQARARLDPDEEEKDMPDNPGRTLPPEALDAWARALRERFELGEDDLPVSLILDLARDVANAVARPAAPFSAYVAGLVAGRAGGSPEQVRRAVAEITALAEEWPPS